MSKANGMPGGAVMETLQDLDRYTQQALDRAYQEQVFAARREHMRSFMEFNPSIVPTMERHRVNGIEWDEMQIEPKMSVRPPIAAIARKPAPPIEPTTHLVAAPSSEQTEEALFLADYQRIATKIGYRCAEATQQLAETELEAYLHQEEMPVYVEAAVVRYLDQTVLEMNAKEGSSWGRNQHSWAWMPLRECDLDEDTNLTVYTKSIPYPVLLTIEKLVDKFGERVVLEVSDIYTVPKADPFLAVSAPGSKKRFIVERWDEPKFRG